MTTLPGGLKENQVAFIRGITELGKRNRITPRTAVILMGAIVRMFAEHEHEKNGVDLVAATEELLRLFLQGTGAIADVSVRTARDTTH